jgi:hypothetical protein
MPGLCLICSWPFGSCSCPVCTWIVSSIYVLFHSESFDPSIEWPNTPEHLRTGIHLDNFRISAFREQPNLGK